MQKNAFLLALAAGIISAVVFASATTGALFLRVILYLLTPLSLYLAGLGLGTVAAAIAGIMATVIVLLIANPLAAEVYAVSTALPAIVCTHLATLSREAEGEREWYPIGRVVVIAGIFSAMFAVVALVLMGGSVEALSKMMRTVIESFVKSELSQIPGAPAIGSAEIDEITRSTLTSLPWALGLLAMGTILINMWLAGRITLASGRLRRPWPNLSDFKMPAAATFVLLVAIGLSFAGGMTGLIASAVAAPFALAFALVGIAVAHALTRGSPWQGFILAALYVAVIFIPHIGLLLALAGLAETIFNYRAIIGNSTNSQN